MTRRSHEVRPPLRTAHCALGPISVISPRLAVLSVLALPACATIQEPPGGPPDLTPPTLVAATPDSGAVVPGLKDAAVFRFSEIVAEPPATTLQQMILVSPRPRSVDVSWKRDAISVKPAGGWKPDVVYRVTLLPGLTDLRNNKLPAGRTLVFSTGATIPNTTLTGRVIDWETGTAGARALVEAIRIPDSLVYWDVADSVGSFNMVAVPPGEYVLSATMDKNTNRKRDYREPFDSAVVKLDSSASRTFWAFTHDSVGPRLRQLTRPDSTTIKAEFNQALRPGTPDSGAIAVFQLPDSTAVPLAAVLTQSAYDTLQAAAARAAAPSDTGKAGAGARTPTGAQVPAPRAPAPTGAPPRVPAAVPGRAGLPTGAGLAGGPPTADSVITRLLKEREKLSPSLVIRTAAPLAPGGRYVVRARVANPSGATGESSQVLVVPAAADTTKKAR